MQVVSGSARIRTVDHASIAVGTSAVQLLASLAGSLEFGVLIKADINNTGVIYVGNSDVTAASGTLATAAATDGYPLAAGDELPVPVADAVRLYAVASAAGQRVFIFYS